MENSEHSHKLSFLTMSSASLGLMRWKDLVWSLPCLEVPPAVLTLSVQLLPAELQQG